MAVVAVVGVLPFCPGIACSYPAATIGTLLTGSGHKTSGVLAL